ncbi:MAG: BatD family protein [Bacteroidales bacterium]|nr:BatD family protein [Bacteroidales bacterium]
MKKKTLIIWLFSLFMWLPVLASEPSFTASAPSQVAVGERFRVVYSANKRPASFNGPAFGEFRVLSGPNQSSSSSTQIINGQVTHSENFSFTYILEATREGSFNIPGATITVEGRNFSSNELSIRVSGQAARGAQPSAPAPGQQQAPAAQGVSDRDIYLRAVVSNANPYQGQAVTLTYKLYTRVVVSQYSIEKLPAYQGFWAEDVTPSGQPQVTEEVIDGQRYNVATIRQVVLFPQRSGELSIEPLDMQTLVRVSAPRRSGSLLDEFFGGSPFGGFQNVERNLRSNQVRVNVRALPAQNRPPSFRGMVGSFELNTGLSPLEVNVNEPVTLTLTINGSGNLRMLEKPEIQFPANLEAFDPNITDNIRISASGVSGSRQYEYLLIPRTGGTFEIPPIQFSFFDPAASRYVTRSSPAYSLTVTGTDTATGEGSGAARQEDVQYLASDIRFINNTIFYLQPKGSLFFRSKLFWFLLIGPVFLFAFFLVYWRRHIRLQSNTALLRNRKAQKMARKRLKKAGAFLKSGNSAEFYDEIFRALWGYLSDKLSIPVSRLNKEQVSEVFGQKGVPEEMAGKFLETLNECEFARFAPGSPQTRMDETYQRALDTIVTLEKELKYKKF